jgi:Ca2+-binding RTX toxin-like protein
MEGGAGNDILTGRAGDDYLNGGLNRDNLIGGGGNDTLEGGFADDTLNGGADTDTALYDGFNGGITVNLNLSGAQNTGAAGSDTFISIENLIGDDFNDRFTGTTTQNMFEGGSGSDRLFGIGGDDTLFGGAGNDNIQGGGGDDTITGGLGRDIMRGGTGDDVFIFNDISESVVGGQRSRIDNFSFNGADGNDTVDISAIDANSILGGDQAFSFISDDAFSNTAGELRFFEAPGPRRIAEGDVNGDGIADFQIEFFNFNSILIANDFIL